MIKQKNKIIYTILLIVYLVNSFNGIAYAIDINSAQLVNLGDCGYHLQFWDTKQNAWSYIITTMVGYNYQGETHYAYCLDSSKDGVGEADSYNVDIATVLDDVRIWRTITAGFPYHTPEEIGCSTIQDAFVATKQAVYCILYDYNPETKYKGGDIRGEQIKNAIINLVNEGRYGSRTPVSANVTINKVGELYQSGDYYYQELSVSSFVNIGNYKITATNGLPQGSKILTMNNQEQTTFNGNENFKIAIPINENNKNIEITIGVRAECENYPVFYGKAPSSNLQDYALTYDPYGDEQGILTFNIDIYKSTLKIIKEDSETKQRIPNVVFNFKYENGENIGNYTTDKNGEITINNLRAGNIIITELETDKNYILEEKESVIELEYSRAKTVTISNDRKQGNLQIYKIDKDNNKIALGNVEFDLYSKELNKVIGTYFTNADGIINIKNLRVGDYSLIEKSTNKWYDLADNKNIKIEWNKTTNVTVENELKKGQIRIIKVDADNNEILLEGVKFGIYDKNNKLLETVITNKEGKALTQKYPIRDFETLKIVELETKQEYVLNESEKTIKLEENQIKNIIFENEKIKGKLQITKVDKEDNEKTLEGAIFGIYDENDKLIQEITTDKNGIATSDILYKGKYYCKELETGSKYYLLNTENYEFEIEEHNKTIEITIENEPVDITVTVDKTGDVETKPGEIVNYSFSNLKNKSNTYLEKFEWHDYIPTDYIRIDKLQTGTWNQELKYKVYYKTNKTEDYILFRDELDTKVNNEIDFNEIELDEDEYIIEFYCDFGKVDVGFKEEIEPSLTCKVLDDVEDKSIFINHTKTVGNYYDMKAEADSDWKTIVNIPEEITEIELPKTGR